MLIEDFVAAQYEPVRRALALAIGDRSRAEELTQEAFAQAWRRWPTVSAMERPVAWVYVVAMNRERRSIRRRYAARPFAPASLVEPDLSVDVSTAVSLDAALRLLPLRQREAVVLRYLADLTVPEVAKAMGCAEGTIKSTLHAALARLRVELEED